MGTLVKFFILFLFSQLLNAQTVSGYDIIVKINNLESNQGKVYVEIYDSQEAFLNKGLKSTVVKITEKSCDVTFKNIPKGIYAISMFHDKNDNNKMDTNFLGIPIEDYGCSNNAKGFMGPPKWEDAKFEVNDKSITQTITL
ncbi:DUF2141 domain-containing protein [Psychroserpens burtonensis]|uniref:DUF2141 domain-containing protein n=1 Tax=Psychroserpens burtonensis TaxID=49278 RepID=A0A5C7BF83_9FLAO|nr:DUF2141 domain-containing protein [Psychroserpens burtonensis]TXE17077.1 DUF2141 domain-containing protein [Psychroserpens burtonensis]